MLRISIPASECYDEARNLFICSKGQTITLEHSLVSVSKWEAKYHVPFLTHTDKPKTPAETMDYIRFMTLTQNVDPNVYNGINNSIMKQIRDYMENPMTATWFSNIEKDRGREEITSELIYFWMVHYGIPFECQKWHLNRLMTLIKICHVKNLPPKKMGKNELLQRNFLLNEARKKQFGTRG